MYRKFHGKIMLFGEYSVMEGSPAVLIPYLKVNARLSFASQKPNQKAVQSNKALQSLAGYIHKKSGINNLIDLPSLNNDLEAGLYLESNIPQNKGLGSSGAVCAAIFDAYKFDKSVNTDLNELRTIFGRMESHFHGSSSGADPLCIYLNEPVIIDKAGCQPAGAFGQSMDMRLIPFLVDTGKDSRTAPLVRHFRERMKEPEYAGKFSQQYIPLVEHAVKQWKNGDLQQEILYKLSEAQLEFLDAMIPDGVRKIWHLGISERLYILKLCGSGGGGMMLGFTGDSEGTEHCFREKFGMEIQLI